MATPFASLGHSDKQEKLRQVEGSPKEQPETGVLKTVSRGGFECEFVERPPGILQTDCPVCLLIVREPNQVTCCGYSFCRACIEQVVSRKKPCPTCNEAEFSVFPDKRLQRSLYQFRVRCEHQKEGCEWSGELGQLDKHVNENPGLVNQLEGCEFTRVACIHCVRLFERHLVTAHQIGSCPKRPFSCDYCGDYVADFEDVVTRHWPACGYRPIPCPNECGVYPERQNVHEHVNKDCPLTLVNCDFHYAGCQVRLPRKDIQSHLHENLPSHMALLGANSQRMAEKVMEKDEQIRRLTNELSKKLGMNEQKIDKLEKENQALRNSLEQTIAEVSKEASKRAQEASRDHAALKFELAGLKNGTKKDCEALKQDVAQLSSKLKQETLLSYVPIFPINITMTDFEKHKKDDDIWCSEPFYTHPHVSVYINLMRGEFDEHLKWPFQVSVTSQLLNQLDDKKHRKLRSMFNRISESDTVAGVSSEERASFGLGSQMFISHSGLSYNRANNSQYLKDNCLRFQVTSVSNLDYTTTLERRCSAIESRMYMLPVDFTVTDFSQQKLEDDLSTCHSPTFYTQPRGYGMCLRVYANGRGDGVGTHIAVYVYLVPGDFDNSLKWPFRGDITIQLLNQLEDQEHYTKTIPFTERTPDSCAGRVVTGETGDLWGYGSFIAHTKLNYDSTTNCQYLKDDCLHFRVTKVEVKN